MKPSRGGINEEIAILYLLAAVDPAFGLLLMCNLVCPAAQRCSYRMSITCLCCFFLEKRLSGALDSPHVPPSASMRETLGRWPVTPHWQRQMLSGMRRKRRGVLMANRGCPSGSRQEASSRPRKSRYADFLESIPYCDEGGRSTNSVLKEPAQISLRLRQF